MAIWSEETIEGMGSYFSTFDDAMSSTVAIIAFFMVILAPIYITYVINKNIERLNDNEML
jgi:hypothetical protein